MTSEIKEKSVNTTTEEKIMEAAREVFFQKGYAAARTRDIAKEAGINIALLNYYFRSKEKLFKIIMIEEVQQFYGVIFSIINNDKLTLDIKIEMITENYINVLIKNPELPLFIFNSTKNNLKEFKEKSQIHKILDSSFFLQIKERNSNIEPIQFLFSLMGMIIIPFIAKQIIFSDEKMFNELMKERKKLIIAWSKAILDTK